MPSCERMLEEIGVRRSSPPSSVAESTTTTNIADFTEPTWTKEGLGCYSLKRTTTRGGERQSAWAAFVSPVTTMPNLRVKDDAVVSRVIIEGGRAVGVEVVESGPRRWWGGRGTRVRQLRLAKENAEIFICCGAFRSPKLLMLSGVGPREHLEDKGVAVTADMPHVSTIGSLQGCCTCAWLRETSVLAPTLLGPIRKMARVAPVLRDQGTTGSLCLFL